MQNALYYPGIEIKNESWLKFALIYFETLNFIVPTSQKNNLSDLTKKIKNESNLYHEIKIEDSYKKKATEITIEISKDILENPQRYEKILKISQIRSKLKNKNTHDFLLYGEKYPDDFYDYCYSKKILTPDSKGIYINETLGNLYMTIFANEISKNKEIDMITDNKNMYKVMPLINSLSLNSNTHDDIENIIKDNKIDLPLPANLDTFEIDEIIKIRNSNGYMEALKGFHNTLNTYLKDNVNDNFGNYLDQKKDLSDFFYSLIPDFLLYISSLFALYPNHFPMIYASVTFLLQIRINQKNFLDKDYKNIALTRRFFSNLEKLKS